MANEAMNRLIQRSRRERVGLMDRVAGAELGERRQDALNEAMARVESAIKTGDHILIAKAEEHMDAVLSDVRAARQTPHEGQEPERPVSFDGGVRGRRPVAPSPAFRQESAAELFQKAMAVSRAERSERGDDARIIVTNR